MNRTFTSAFIIIGISLALSGCRADFTSELNATESLLKVVEKVEASSAQIDAPTVRRYSNEVSDNCRTIHEQFSDTMALEQAEILANYCSLDEHLKNCLERKQRIDEQILSTRVQLSNLKTDLIGRRADKDSTKLYIEQEFLFVESLNESTDQLLVEVNACFVTYAELKEGIERSLNSLPSTDEQ